MLPLPFSRILGGLKTSEARIFWLPDELISRIIQFVDFASFGSLALVDRDCHQLARSRRFICVREVRLCHQCNYLWGGSFFPFWLSWESSKRLRRLETFEY